ncbi:hypothetical protein [Ahrensia sp. 13_GOM-1096m]|uniref:hypothetical protein n=1 Tax=Ahrensia sp. 13_GOM-1096m TaxID=1380380 RepID=UPI000AE12B79|nr:hypothetical protein [Ahrensia sp. 13_GOM-1096m]
MSNLETALRAALKKGDIDSPIFRRKVYESAASAMQRSLEARGSVTKEALDAQNKRLADVIRTIEADLKAAPKPAAKAPPAPQQAPVAQRTEPTLDGPVTAPPPMRDTRDEPSLYVEPRPEMASAKPSPNSSEKKGRKKGTRAPFAKMLTAAVLVSFLGVGFFWIFTTDGFKSEEARDTSVPNPKKVLESESFEGRDPGTSNAPATLDSAANDDEWVKLFSPNDPTTLGLVAGATAEMMTDPFGDFVYLVTPNDEAEVQIDVPLSLMQQAPGRTMQISFIAHADDDAPTQMSVTCDLGALGDCGRLRFNLGQAPQEYLMQVQVPSDARASKQGILKIVTDIENEARAIKLLVARARLLNN